MKLYKAFLCSPRGWDTRVAYVVGESYGDAARSLWAQPDLWAWPHDRYISQIEEIQDAVIISDEARGGSDGK